MNDSSHQRQQSNLSRTTQAHETCNNNDTQKEIDNSVNASTTALFTECKHHWYHMYIMVSDKRSMDKKVDRQKVDKQNVHGQKVDGQNIEK